MAAQGSEGAGVSTLGEVIAQIREALRLSGDARQHLARAADLIEEATQLLAQACYGSTNPEAEQALALLAQAEQGIAELYELLEQAENGVQRYLDHLGADTTVGTVTATAVDSKRTGEQSDTPRERVPLSPSLTPARIERLRAELPPPVTSGAGQKTHGRWIAADGRVHAEMSGKDEKYDEALQLFKNMKVRRIPVRASDVEMKLAAHMRKNGIRSATLIINHVPCEGPLGCDALVSVILPKGYTLTVYGANGFVREYKGGETSPWLP